MDAIELEKYEYQLSQIKLALAKDPENVEYQNLKEELTSLIELTKEYLASAAPAPVVVKQPSTTPRIPRPTPAPSTPTENPDLHIFKSGDECLARYSLDQKFYPARITSIVGSTTAQLFSVIFAGYDSTEVLSRADIKPITESRKRQLMTDIVVEDEAEKEKKRKKMEKKKEVREVKSAEQGAKQKSWQSFAKKGTKKGVNIPGISGSSMFSSPADLNPNAKVGVTGSGKGMTVSKALGRQTFREGSS